MATEGVLSIIDIEDFEKKDFLFLLEGIEDEIKVIIDDEEIDFSINEEDIYLPSIVELSSEDDELLNSSNIIQTTRTVATTLYICPNCTKPYKKISYYEKHVETCKGACLYAEKGPALSDSSQERLKNIFSDLFWIVINLTSKDLILNLSFGLLKSPGNITALLASKISTERELYGSCFNDFIGYLLLKMLPILNLYSSTAVSREKICKLLHSLCICEELNKKFYSALKYFHIDTKDQLNLQPAYMLKNVVITKMYEKSLIWRNTELFPCQKEQPSQLELTLNEQKVLHYVGGFILFSLIKHYRFKENSVAKVVCRCLHEWQIGSGEEFYLENVTSWTNRVNRGGLVCINNDFYIFILHKENVARKVLNKYIFVKYKGKDLRDVLTKKLNKSELIDLSWSSLSRNLNSDYLVQILKQVIFKKWISMRARSFLTTIINLMKRQNATKNISVRNELSLCKSLKSTSG
ncbi:uncharacterized protein LOC136081049 [Hydra vulgaris]|uniref:Uncharacterized protein LOC136081049 n=1 Tax=Hydra vulgaris TaxID=6087 RepID=A0ABM4BYY4_HYDVU